MLVTRNSAGLYAAALKAAANESLKRVLLFGSTLRDAGRDLDIIVEVPEEAFIEYARQCVGALDGYHPLSGGLLPMASAYWNYQSPKTHRLGNALRAIGIISEQMYRSLALIVPHDHVDMLCLPVGWTNQGYADGLLAKAFGFCKDPNTLKNIATTAIEL